MSNAAKFYHQRKFCRIIKHQRCAARQTAENQWYNKTQDKKRNVFNRKLTIHVVTRLR